MASGSNIEHISVLYLISSGHIPRSLLRSLPSWIPRSLLLGSSLIEILT